MIADKKIEALFSHAVAMDQSGRLRNSVYGVDRTVYVVNSDFTVALRFQLPTTSPAFSAPIGFAANDYDSPAFDEVDGHVVFTTEGSEFIRSKTCATADRSVDEVAALFDKYPLPGDNVLNVHKDSLSLLDESLSHIEVWGRSGKAILVQRNIYTGASIRLTRPAPKGFGLGDRDKFGSDFGPLGLRTNDFMALFSFNDEVQFIFGEGEAGYCRVRGRNFRMEGVVSHCVYDDMGTLTVSKTGKADGRKLPKKC